MSDEALPDAELDVMRCLWLDSPLTARAIREQLQEERPMSHSSVCTLLARLEGKKLVTREKGNSGKAFVYRPTIAPTATRRRLVRDLLNRLFAGSGVQLVATLFESQPPSEKQLGELQQLLDDLRARKRKRGRAEEEDGGNAAWLGRDKKKPNHESNE